jgi:hypothetical protein
MNILLCRVFLGSLPFCVCHRAAAISKTTPTTTTTSHRITQNQTKPNQPTNQPTMVVSIITPGQVNYCNSEQEYYEYLQKAGDNLIVIDCFAEWYDHH